MKKYKTLAIEIDNKQISYALRPHKGAKRFRLTVYADRGLVVTVPKRNYDPRLLNQFIRKHSDWILSKISYYSEMKERLGIGDREKEYRERRKEARELVMSRINYFCSLYDFPVGRVTIKNQRTRWGSCSGRRNLNFNYRVVLLSPELADYVIFHELCHLVEFNHSMDFWNLVAREIPDYRKLREELKQHNLSFY